jgi:uncharacterized protein
MPYRALLLAAAVLALSLNTPSARAQTAPDAARLAAAREMMQVAGVARQFSQVMPVLMRQLAQGFVAVAPDKAEVITDVFVKLGGKFDERKSELIDQIAALYAEQLNLEELNAVIGFYRSPAGAKMMSIQPQVMRQSMLLGQRWGAQLGREIEAEARRELKKRGIEL